MSRLTAYLWLRSGMWLERKGLPSIAEACLRHASQAGGRSAEEASLELGKRLIQSGRYAGAMECYQALVQASPGCARAWCGLGAAQRHASEMDAARQSFERAVALDPDYPQALNNLGEWWLVRGDIDRALGYFDCILKRTPDFYEAMTNRVAALTETDRVEEAEQAAREAIERYPDSAPLHVNLGNVLVHTGRGRPGLLAYRRALELDPANEDARFNLAILQCDTGSLESALVFAKRQIEIKGESASRLITLATALKATNHLTEAIEICRRVIAGHPGHVSGLVLLGSCMASAGDSAQAAEFYEAAVRIRPEMAAIFSNILHESTYFQDRTPDQTFSRHREWAERYETPAGGQRFRHAKGGDPGRLLRIGYVSGDFCSHPVGILFRGVAGRHDHTQYEIHCYSNFLVEDPITEEIRSHADHWHDVALMGVEDVAEMIYRDRIDILVDLSGHTAFNRLPVFALTPAPIQATWIGYFHSTGMETIDYFITDPFTSPKDSKQLFTETPVHLPHSRFCYTPPDYVPEVVQPQIETEKRITFGSFNRLVKLNDQVVQTWSDVLAALPDSRLVIKTRGVEEAEIGGRLLERFAARGISSERIVLRPPSGHLQMFNEYAEIDIALDTFPFNGGITTLEALWMGVPVVTIAGDGVVSRQSFAILQNIGLGELAFADTDAFVRGAVNLAGDRERLAELRRTLRPRMEASPLRQPEQFTRDLEALYRRMWQAWCEGRRLPSDLIAK